MKEQYTFLKETSQPGAQPDSRYQNTTCTETAAIGLVPSNTSDWVLQTFSANGSKKTTGGDELYITFFTAAQPAQKGKPTAVAMSRDLGNGRYELSFLFSEPRAKPRNDHPSGPGFLVVVLQYSCGLGSWAPPTKDGWRTGGHVDRVFRSRVASTPPAIARLDAAAAVGQHVNAFLAARHIVVVGDSLARQLVLVDGIATQPRSPAVTYVGVQAPLSSITLQAHFLAPLSRPDVRSLLSQPTTLLLLNSGVWDILEAGVEQRDAAFSDHLSAMAALLTAARAMLHPRATLLWKSMTAMHIHAATCWRPADDHRCGADHSVPCAAAAGGAGTSNCFNRIKYLSSSRAQALWRAQAGVAARAGVPVLDYYNLTYVAAASARPRDGRHYAEAFNHWLFRTTSHLV